MVEWDPSVRGVSPVVGVALLVAIVVVLSVLTMTSLGALSESALDSSAVHGTGSYDFTLYGDNAPVLRVTPESVNTRNSEYRIRINGEDVYDQWDGKSQLEIECLSPWDEVTVYTAKGSTTNLVKKYDVQKFLQCPDKIGDGRFEHAYFNGDKVSTQTEYDLPLAIDPDGPDSDSGNVGLGNDNDEVHKQDIGKIPFSNPWHYSKLYNDDDGTIEGYQKPVWLFILVDNVHWTEMDGSVDESLNWTDDPSSTPGVGNFERDGSTITPKPYRTPPDGAGEPTNDVYIVFKPVCESEGKSKLKVIYVDAGYSNQILMDGEEVVPDTSTLDQRTKLDDEEFDAPGIPC